MPMPVSCTETETMPGTSSAAAMVIRPRSGVNLCALLKRLMSTCFNRLPSAVIMGSVAGSFMTSVCFFSMIRGSTSAAPEEITSRSDCGPKSSAKVPLSILEISRMSEMMLSRCLPARLIRAAYSPTFAAAEAPAAGETIKSEKPMIALSGVRSSWLILARNSDLARLAIACSMVAARSACSERSRETHCPKSAE